MNTSRFTFASVIGGVRFALLRDGVSRVPSNATCRADHRAPGAWIFCRPTSRPGLSERRGVAQSDAGRRTELAAAASGSRGSPNSAMTCYPTIRRPSPHGG